MGMPSESNSERDLVLENQKLQEEVQILKQEKIDLEILLETTMLHADLVEQELYRSNQKLQEEITEHQRTEQQLRASEKKLQSLLESLSQTNTDLEIMLETTTAHGDLIEKFSHDLSIRDSLTGLFNRRYMEESLVRHLRRAKEQDEPLSIIMGDIDHFKGFNDRWGHQAGDVVLKAVSRFLENHTRLSDTTCRYGGEEFVIILPSTTIEDAHQIAEFLREGIKNLHHQYSYTFMQGLTMSMGVAGFPIHADCQYSLIRAADMALYYSKTHGRDRITIASLSLCECLKNDNH